MTFTTGQRADPRLIPAIALPQLERDIVDTPTNRQRASCGQPEPAPPSRAGRGELVVGPAAPRPLGPVSSAWQAADLGETRSLSGLAEIRYRAGDRDAATVLARQPADFDNPIGLRLVAGLHREADDPDAATALYQRAIDGVYTSVLQNLVQVGERAGGTEGAYRLLQLGLDDDGWPTTSLESTILHWPTASSSDSSVPQQAAIQIRGPRSRASEGNRLTALKGRSILAYRPTHSTRQIRTSPDRQCPPLLRGVSE